jgi:cell filamentation protein
MLLQQALMEQVEDRSLFMKGMDVSCYFEGFVQFRTGDV